MKFIHLSDLHIGKRLSEHSLMDDMEHILQQILNTVDSEKPNGVIIAGDVYDTTVPTIDSVNMLNWFITELSERKVAVFLISGNHDSSDRLGFGSSIFEKNNIFFSTSVGNTMAYRTISDGSESVDVYMLPYVSPRGMGSLFPDREIKTHEDAVKAIIENTPMKLDSKKILIAHQFVINGDVKPEISESEMITVGGIDSVSSELFDMFDYVALGHIHNPQSTGRDTVRYCGTPLVFSKSEVGKEKSMTVIEIDDSVSIRTIPFVPKRNVRVLKGPLQEIIDNASDTDDFVYLTLTDEPINAMSRLREIYPNVVSLEFDVFKSGAGVFELDLSAVSIDPEEAFIDLFRKNTDKDLTNKQKDILHKLLSEEVILP